ncbi:MAG TPA: ATP-binding protein, partial [Labilithrix sp.]|nr:ATP-binding protein [Labilithrix sp.]
MKDCDGSVFCSVPSFSLVVFIGLQASGKTTFFRQRFAETHAHVSKDNFRNARHRDQRQLRLLEDALRAGNGIVLDNTDPAREDRALAIAKAKELGAAIVGFYFESRVATCRERNALRDGTARVPEVALRSTAARLERPRLDEGFSRLW